jgi:diacylglycerol kinase (ATP)
MASFLRSRLRSFRFAFDGLRYVLKTQKNAWIHSVVSVIVVVLGFWLSISTLSWAIIFLTMGMVWAAECFNTAIETIIDLVSPQDHPLAKIGKDVGAAAVLISAMMAVLIGISLMGSLFLAKLSLR